MKSRRAKIPLWLGMAVIALTAWMALPTVGVREIHNADRITNFALVEPKPHENDWPWRGGIDGRNVAINGHFPEQWKSNRTNGWHVDIPGNGNSSPTVWGQLLFLVTTTAEPPRVELRCFDRGTGREKWWTALPGEVAQRTTDHKPLHLPSPACDGQFVYIPTTRRGTLVMSAVDFSGRIAWHRDVGPYDVATSDSNSPVLFQSLVIVTGDRAVDGFLAALHRQTGEIIWRIRRPAGGGEGLPLIANLAGRAQLIVAGKKTVDSYDPATGKSLWTYRWMSDAISKSLAFDNEYVFAVAGRPQTEVVCIRADGRGDVTKTNVVWSHSKASGQNPLAVYHAGWLYILSDDGGLKCIDATSGKTEWVKSLKGRFSAAPIIAADRLICCNEEGQCYLVSTTSDNPSIAENTLPEGITASPIAAGDSVFVRTYSGLFRFRSSPQEPIAERPDRSKRRL